ncbi:hypothetical protein PVAND_017037 [Polypedilum vanderplanki]|uniref:NACHT domain-containing protein n=1 Tax=Polypedilum vanderplanki TaxID=319348 RepID=A0A9J6BI73_POLVA|nr:hypothetical protein PVAND_017037 [Polypedilum vanderplanki]
MNLETLQIILTNEIEFSKATLEDFNEDGNDLSWFNAIEVLNCPTTEAAVNFITSNSFYESLFERRMKLIALRLKIENDLDTNDIIIPKADFYNEKRKFLVTYEGKNKTAIFWKNQFAQEFLKLDLENSLKENSVELFAVEFMIEKLKENGGQIKSSAKVTKLSSIIDQNGKNLLSYAVENRKLEIIQKLLKLSFDVNEKYEAKRLVDIAWENDDQDIVLELLNANSYYPENFNESKANEEIQKFIQNSKKLHTAIKKNVQKEVKEILEKNKNLRHFFTTSNISALNSALKCENFEIYKILYKESKTFGPNEKFDKSLNEEFYKRIAKLNSDLSLHLPVSHISILLSKTVVPPCDDLTEKLQSVQTAFEKINQIPEVNLMLQVLATNSNLKIHFDFTQESVIYMDPTNRNTNIKGCYDHENNHLHIAALELSNEATEHITHATISHESSHCVLDMIFRNKRFPFAINDAENEVKYMEILSEIEKDYGKNSNNCNKEKEQIIEDVFISDKSDENSKIRELIARVPDLLAFYQGDERRLDQIKTEFKNLFDYWTENVMIAMTDALPVLQKLSDYSIEINYDDFTKPLQSAIKYSKVEFQGYEVKLEQIIDQNILQKLNSKTIRKILDGHNLNIQEKLEFPKDEFYKERNFIDSLFNDKIWIYDDVMNYLAKEAERDFQSIFAEVQKSKIFLLSDHAGAGKSTTMKNLAVKLKNEFPQNWVEFVDLKRHLEVYERIENSEISDIETIIKIFQEIFKINENLNAKIFEKLFKENRVILFLDGVDEIAPKFKQIFIKIITSIKNLTRNQQWIATRPHTDLTKELKEKLNIEIAYKLLLINHIDAKAMIKKYLKLKDLHFDQEQIEKILLNVSKVQVKSSDNSYNNSIQINPLMIKMIADLCAAKKLENFDSNRYKLYENLVDLKLDILSEKGAIPNRDSNTDSKMNIWEIHQIYALKLYYDKNDKFEDFLYKEFYESDWQTTTSQKYEKRLLNFSQFQIFKKWNREKLKWSAEAISRCGLLIVDNWNTDSEFPDFSHRSFAEFFVAKFIIEAIKEALEDDEEIIDSEFKLRMNLAVHLLRLYCMYSKNLMGDSVLEFIMNYISMQEPKIKIDEHFLTFLNEADTKKLILKTSTDYHYIGMNTSLFAKLIRNSNFNEKLFNSLMIIKNGQSEMFKNILNEKISLFSATSCVRLFDLFKDSKFPNWHKFTGSSLKMTENDLNMPSDEEIERIKKTDFLTQVFDGEIGTFDFF